MERRFAIILAAGKSTRMKSGLPKVLHSICGKTMIQHVVSQALQLDFHRLVTVIGHGGEQIRAQLGHTVEYAIQEDQQGTAHAVMQAAPLLGKEAGTAVVLYGDTPLLQSSTIQALLREHEAKKAKMTVLTAMTRYPSGYGRVIRSADQTVMRIVEECDTSADEKQIQEINTGVYCFDNLALFQALKQVKNENAQGEYYLPDVIGILQKQGHVIFACRTDHFSEMMGVNDRLQLAEAEKRMRIRINAWHMKNGVTLTNPDDTYITPDVKIGRDTIIYPGTFLSGDTTIGKSCTIGPHSEIMDSHIGNRTVIHQSVVAGSWIGSDAKIGPFAHVRPASEIADQVKIGNFVEVKKSEMGQGSKASHLSYIGDAKIGRDVNLGCGSITVNYDGQNKYLTQVGDGAFIGCNVNLIAPVTIGKNAFVAAGSTVTDPVPDEALSIARSRQTTKENYIRKSKRKET